MGEAAYCFNPRARAGRDCESFFGFRLHCGFNPRARAGRDDILRSLRRRLPGFNPRARAGRDFASRDFKPVIRVSIHAPARGATKKTTR